jgi:hypothetical protein
MKIGHMPAEVKGGRPTQYRPEYADQAERLCLLGATDKILGEFFGVTETTVNNWKRSQPEFFESLKAGKVGADIGVADSLHQRALGFEYDEAQPIKLKEVIYENGKRVREIERVETVMVHHVVPPDTTACIFWLKNRRSDAWRDKHDVEHAGKNGGPLTVTVRFSNE